MVKNSRATGITKENTVLVPALQMLAVRRQCEMEQDLFDRIIKYKSTMATVKIMKNTGLISEKEYEEAETIIAEKYGLNLSVIYR